MNRGLILIIFNNSQIELISNINYQNTNDIVSLKILEVSNFYRNIFRNLKFSKILLKIKNFDL
jgi:hypothetical protein